MTLVQVSLYARGFTLSGWSKAAGARTSAAWHKWARDANGRLYALCTRLTSDGPKSRIDRFHPSPFGHRCQACVDRAAQGENQP